MYTRICLAFSITQSWMKKRVSTEDHGECHYDCFERFNISAISSASSYATISFP